MIDWYTERFIGGIRYYKRYKIHENLISELPSQKPCKLIILIIKKKNEPGSGKQDLELVFQANAFWTIKNLQPFWVKKKQKTIGELSETD